LAEVCTVLVLLVNVNSVMTYCVNANDR